MTRTYALKRLLEHGAMDTGEIVACTRWTRKAVLSALNRLAFDGILTRQNARHGYLYGVTT